MLTGLGEMEMKQRLKLCFKKIRIQMQGRSNLFIIIMQSDNYSIYMYK